MQQLMRPPVMRITDIRAGMRRKMKKTYSHLMKRISVKVNLIRTMQELAEYHFGNSGESSKEDGNMNGLYEFHHGKI